MTSEEMRNKEECRQIWQTVFCDSEAFVDLYFSRRYTKAGTFVSRHDGRIVAQAQCLTYRMTAATGQPPLRIGYVSGLATLPEFRRQGHALHVMTQLHQWAYGQSLDYVLLIPADDQAAMWYASHFGYRHTASRRKRTLTPAQTAALTKLPALTPHLIDIIRQDLAATPYTVQHTNDDLADQFAVCQMSGGGLYSSPQGILMAERYIASDGTESYIALDTFGNTTNHPLSVTHSPSPTPCLYLPVSNPQPLPPTIRLTLMLD